MNFEWQRRLDSRLGPLLVPLAEAGLRRAQARAGRAHPPGGGALLIKLHGLGSVTLTLPLVAALKAQAPGRRLSYLTLPAHLPLLRRVQHIDHVQAVDPSKPGGWPRALAEAALWVRAQGFDAVYDLEPLAHSTGLLTAASGAPTRVGLRHSALSPQSRERLYTQTVDLAPVVHMARLWRQMAGVAVGEAVRFPPLVGLEAPEPQALPLVVVNANASDLALERRWPADRFAQLCDALVARGARVQLIGLGSERAYTQGVRDAMAHPEGALNRCGELDLDGLIQLMRAATLVVTNDSGPLHLASALGLPTVTFFGPETPLRYGSLSPRQLSLFADLWCSPCLKTQDLKRMRCINAGRCMTALEPASVVPAVVTFLDELLGASPPGC